METPPQNRDREALRPDFRLLCDELERCMEAVGFPVFLTEGARSDERQAALYGYGRTAVELGEVGLDPALAQPDRKKVTKALPGQSSHQMDEEGLARAADYAFREPPIYDGPWALFGEMAKALGLKWGGDWRSPDQPHVYL